MFREAEISLLVPQISEAFRLAKENERVTYYLSQPQTSIKRIITSGGLYVKGTELHFILGNWQIVYGIPAYGMIYDRRYPMSPMVSKGFDLYFDQERRWSAKHKLLGFLAGEHKGRTRDRSGQGISRSDRVTALKIHLICVPRDPSDDSHLRR